MLRLCLAVLLTLLLSPPSAALPFTDLFVFGDSIVDVGNAQTSAGGPGSPNDPTPASAGATSTAASPTASTPPM